VAADVVAESGGSRTVATKNYMPASDAIVWNMPNTENQQQRDRDEPVKIDLDPEVALRALLDVDPDAPVPQDEPVKDQGDPLT